MIIEVRIDGELILARRLESPEVILQVGDHAGAIFPDEAWHETLHKLQDELGYRVKKEWANQHVSDQR